MTETQTILKASDLRLGNWVYFDVGDFPRQVTLESFAILSKYPERLSWIKPIELSPEILQMIGFEKSGQLNDTHYWKSDPFISFTFGDYAYSRDNRRGRANITIGNQTLYPANLVYVHQLQNLYHSLTGTELEIDLSH